MKQRLITGPILILATLVLVFLDDRLDTVELSGAWSSLFGGRSAPPRGLLLFTFSAVVLAPLAAIELTAVFDAMDVATRRWLMVLAALLGLAVSWAIPVQTPAITAVALVASAAVALFVIAGLTFSRGQTTEGVAPAIGAVLFAMVYLGLMLGFLLALRRSHTAWWIVGVILTTKSCDIGAYFTGRAIGRRKLIPWLSPGKTWEGLVGGVVTAAVTGLLLALLSRATLDPVDHVPAWLGLVAGVVFALVGQFGDLTMSLFKRGAGLKDSSSILPGMGGVLDVLDSPLMVAPVAFWLLETAG